MPGICTYSYSVWKKKKGKKLTSIFLPCYESPVLVALDTTSKLDIIVHILKNGGNGVYWFAIVI